MRPCASERSMTQLCTLSTGKKDNRLAPKSPPCFFLFFSFFFEQRSTLYRHGPHTHTQTHVYITAPTQFHFMRVATFLLFMFDRFSCWYVKHADSQ